MGECSIHMEKCVAEKTWISEAIQEMQDPDQIDDMSGLSELIFSSGAEHPKTGMRTSWGYSGTGWYRYLPLIKYGS